MAGSRAGWVLLVLPLLAAPLLLHAGAPGPSPALVTVLLAMVLVARLGVLQPGPQTGIRLGGPVRAAVADRLSTPIRSCDPDGRGRARPRAPGLDPGTRA